MTQQIETIQDSTEVANSAQKALTKWLISPEKSLAEIRVNSIAEVLASESPSLAVFRKESGPNGDLKVRALLTVLIKDFIDAYNVIRPMSDVQLAKLIESILKEYYYFKPEDFRLCFDRARTGKYANLARVLDRIDEPTIFAFLNGYNQERIEHAEMVSNQQHKDLKDRPLVISPRIAKELQAAAKLFLPKESEVYVVYGSRSAAAKMIFDKMKTGTDIVQDWMKEFDELYLKTPSSSSSAAPGIRLVAYRGELMGHDTFLRIKNLELNDKLTHYFVDIEKVELSQLEDNGAYRVLEVNESLFSVWAGLQIKSIENRNIKSIFLPKKILAPNLYKK